MMILVQHWPVLERLTDADGKVRRAKNAYRRTAKPTEEREVELTDVLTRTRVTLYFGIGGHYDFSVKTGRRLGRPDWVIEKKALRELRKWLKVYLALAPETPKKEEQGAASPRPVASPAANDI